MPLYYVTVEPREDGFHVLHKVGCPAMPDPLTFKELGSFPGPAGAARKAMIKYSRVKGCDVCCEGFFPENEEEVDMGTLAGRINARKKREQSG